jgi:hypothetical protein
MKPLEQRVFRGYSFYLGGTVVGSFNLARGDSLFINVLKSPVEVSKLHYVYVFLRNHGSGEIVDAVNLGIASRKVLESPEMNVYSISIGVIKSEFFSEEDARGLYEITLRIRGNIFTSN